ncbi:BTAD domain-containing putative transcriptional regulator [Sphingomonas sp. NIBR02145]|uniref:AfsR/SARP family transcriptional regulator n=1 Tax=Sphingomonas sp. NIBR02145 TaxID=3014784 RepID=UPI0022B435D3|nr:BTAD domain-containing putative transcriptional regulator [Sphingomonas sp. NIBR02145]WHU04324.1 BTAD domain-containing putative transcriptional regulator [Sphingomonas sp. NIBR02145]
MPGTWELRLLDGFQLLHDGAPARLTVRKAAALLAFLALQNRRAASRETIVAMLWEYVDRSQGLVSLRQAIASLRKLQDGVPPLLIFEGDMIALSDAVEIDCVRFETLCDGDLAARLTACGLYGGDLLANFHLRDGDAFHEWLAIEQARLRNRCVALLAGITEQGVAELSDHNMAVTAALRLLRIDPFNEPAHRGLMRIYHRQGRTALAIQQFRSLVALLRSELQVAPESETVALYNLLMHHRRDRSHERLASTDQRPNPGTVSTLRPAWRGALHPATPAALGWEDKGDSGFHVGFTLRSSALDRFTVQPMQRSLVAVATRRSGK